MSDNKKNHYKVKYTELRDEQDKLRAENNQLRAENSKLIDEKGKLDDKILELQEENETLKEENENLKEANRKLKTNNKEIDNEPVNNEINEETSRKSPDINMTVEGQKIETSGKSPDINMTVEGQKTETRDKSPDINMTVEGQKTETSGKSPDNNDIEESHKKGCSFRNPRGLVVICWHSTFNKKFKLDARPSAENDAQMMKESWELYGYKVIEFEDSDVSFYNNELISKIKEALETISDIRLFVFVLSTHGWGNPDANVGTGEKHFEHYFFAKDDQVYTQDLMKRISDIETFKDKPKLFVIQACRSRSTDKQPLNQDLGYELEDSLNSTEENKTKVKSAEGKDMADGHGYMPQAHVEDMHTSPELSVASQIIAEQIKEVDKGEGHVKGSMPPEDKQNIHIRPAEGKDMADGHGYMPQARVEDINTSPKLSAGSQNNTKQVKEVDGGTVDLIPHCDDCIVLFASMVGKEAYCKRYSLTESGGWLIKALYDTLKETQNQEKVHLLDILTEVNSKVGKREHSGAEVKAQSCFFHNIAFGEAELYLR